jgi:alpha-glucosidase
VTGSYPFSDKDWWRSGVVYQVYPRSFADSNGDGIGDLPGIIEHLDHLAGTEGSLGVDAIWLSPIYPSPWRDGGYDVSDHSAIHPEFGTMADFERLLREAHDRGLRVILDLVLNHTSNEHPWFLDSRRSRDSEHADWYIWRDPGGFDGNGRPRPPNNWVSWFGGSAWQWEPGRGQFYLHTFLVEQPEVNWRNPELKAAQLAMIRGWLDRGVDGFRLDVFNILLKSPWFESNPRRWWPSRRPWDRQRHLYDRDQADYPELLAEIRAVIDATPGHMSVGEMFAGSLERAASSSADRHIAFDFGLLSRPWSAAAIGAEVDRREAGFGPERWPAVVLSNHDQSRHVSRFLRDLRLGDDRATDRVAKAAAVLLLTLRGTAFMYYGEEIGLPDVAVPPAEIVDPPARRASFLFPWWNRDQCRSPMPWSAGRNGGFTTGRPWMRMIPGIDRRNVAAETGEERSVLAFYRRLLAVRRASPALRSGSLRRMPSGDRDVLTYIREAGGDRVLVALNFATRPRSAALPTGPWRRVISTALLMSDGDLEGALVLDGLEAVVLRRLGGG